MTRITTSLEIDRPATEVFGYFSDLDNRPRWIGVLERVVRDPNEPVRVGSRWREVNRMWGLRFTVDVELIDLEPDRRWIDRVSTGPVPMELGFTFEPRGGSTALHGFVDLQASGPFRALVPLMRPVLRRQLRGDMQRLKREVERLERRPEGVGV